MISLNPHKSKEIISRTSITRFIHTYAKQDNWHNLDAGTGNLGYGWIHYGLIRSNRPKRILVIGSRYGFIPAVCAIACRDNTKGVVDFVDASYNQTTYDTHHWGGVGFWHQNDLAKHFGEFGLAEFIRVHLMKSDEYFIKNKKRTWDYIYLDGDHSYAGVRRDYAYAWRHAAHGGYVALHDIYTQNAGGLTYGVHTLWKEIASQTHAAIEFPGPNGLGLVRKA